MLKETITKNKINLRKDCLTTTELAKLCGVSRFTIINWVNQGKIRTTSHLNHCATVGNIRKRLIVTRSVKAACYMEVESITASWWYANLVKK